MREDFEVPRRLGEYQLRRLIGRGGMGEVWLAVKDGVDKPCVVKVLLPRYSRDPEYRRRFFREARILAQLRHGRIVPMLDHGECQGWLYLVMEYIDGVDLSTFCRAILDEDEVVPINVIAYIIGEVFEALRHAHERAPGGNHLGVIHRDVTPRNVMISSEGEAFLTDFGLARHTAEFSNEVLGTLEYMAPEQSRGKASVQSDLYAAGSVLYFMLCGRAPRKAKSVAEFVASLHAGQPEIERKDVPEPLERLVNLCLAMDPDERIASAHDGILLLDSWPSYRKETTVTATLYKSYVGPRRTGLTGLTSAAEVEMTCDLGPVEHGTQPAARIASSTEVTVRSDEEADAVELVQTERVSSDAQQASAQHSGDDDDGEAGGGAALGAESENESDEPSDAALWTPWWEEDAEEDEDDPAIEEVTTQRYMPPVDRVEPDAPRSFRRSRRDPSTAVDGQPTVMPAVEVAEEVVVKAGDRHGARCSEGNAGASSTRRRTVTLDRRQTSGARRQDDGCDDSDRVIDASCRESTESEPTSRARYSSGSQVASISAAPFRLSRTSWSPQVLKNWLMAAMLVGIGVAVGLAVGANASATGPRAARDDQAHDAAPTEAPATPPEVSTNVRTVQ